VRTAIPWLSFSGHDGQFPWMSAKMSTGVGGASSKLVIVERRFRLLVGPERFELSTNGLKVHCSTAELQAREPAGTATGASKRIGQPAQRSIRPGRR
jgi:hypothetical protein